jgi:hypothetical protein
MSEAVTKKDLAGFAEGIHEEIHRSGETLRSEMRQNTQELMVHFNQSQAVQNEKLDALAEDMSKVKLAVVDLLATDKHMHNLVRELQGQGIALDEKRIFAS